MTALVGLGWFMVFLRAMSPSIGGEDSGEFAAAAWSLGVGHAPGYPLHALAGRLAMAIRAGDPAFRLTLLSAGSASAACAALFAMVRRESADRFGLGPVRSVACGLAASAAFGLGAALWHQATISDKYALHLMLHGAICLAAIRGARPVILGLLVGVAFSHHLQTLYLIPGLGWLAWHRRPTGRTLSLVIGMAVLGLSPKLLYPPVRAAVEPALLLARPDSFGRQLAYLRVGEYADRIAGPAAGSRWRDAFTRMASETVIIGMISGPAGLIVWSRVAGTVAPVAWLTIGTGIALAASLDITGREFYLLPVIWWLAAGTGWLLAAALAAKQRIRYAMVAIALAAAMTPGVINRNWFDRSRMTVERDFGMNLLAGLPPRAVLFASGDDVLYPLFYLQSVLGVRPDVVAIPEGFLSWPPARARIAAALPEAARVLAQPAGTSSEDDWSRQVAAACLAAARPVAMTNPSRTTISTGLHAEVRDAVWEVFSRRRSFPDRPPRWLLTRGWYRPAAGLTERQRWVIGLYAKYQRQSADRIANAGAPVESLPRYRLALANPYLPDRPGALNNFGLALERTGHRDDALAAYRTALADPAATPEIWINAGNLLLGLGRKPEARVMFEAALARSAPGSVHAAYAARKLSGR